MEQTTHMKQFSSDIQVFLGTRQVSRQILREVESTKSKFESSKNYELKVSMHSLITILSNELEEFGKIKVSESATNFDFRDLKLDQAQIETIVPTSRNISDIKLQLIKSFQMKSTHKLEITGCVILPNGNLLMANDTEENHLIEYSDAGEHIRDIPVSGPPYDIDRIDLDRIVVTYGDALYIEIMNCKTFNVEKKISLQHSCLKVSQEDGRLYVVYGKAKIQVMDISGNQIETLKITSEGITCIKTSRQKIYYADYSTKEVHCFRLNGEELWKLECDSIKFPYDITLDSYHNVYVVGCVSNNISIIQHDGKNSKTLLTESDGLYHPTALDFDTDKKTLLICNEEGNVALYKFV
ncbi:uncharacterized protein LOC134694345 [Mytilus trossulus]|uniref:uncharacterized protein LOC134694345 n=1 Tax=Mytilus trossulus TaxID=6551 RepID=UPI003003DDD8